MSQRAFTLLRDVHTAKREQDRRTHRHELRMARGIEVVELSLDGPVVRDNRERRRARARAR